MTTRLRATTLTSSALRLAAALGAALAVTLTACGGGGGDAAGTDPFPPPNSMELDGEVSAIAEATIIYGT